MLRGRLTARSKVQTNQPRLFFGLKMAVNRITDISSQSFRFVAFREDRLAQRAGRVTSLNRLFDQKNYLVHTVSDRIKYRLNARHLCG